MGGPLIRVGRVEVWRKVGEINVSGDGGIGAHSLLSNYINTWKWRQPLNVTSGTPMWGRMFQEYCMNGLDSWETFLT